jgi:WD40 repeat protein
MFARQLFSVSSHPERFTPGGDKTAPLVEIIPAQMHPQAPEVYAQPLPVTALAFSPDGSELIAGGLRELTVWNPTDGKLLRRISNVAPRTFEIVFSADGRWMATGGSDHALSIFDLATGERKHRLVAHSDAVTAVAISLDSQQVASVSLDRAAKVFDLKTGKLISTYREHQTPLYGVAFSPDGTQVMTAGYDKSLHQWKVAEAKKQRELALEGNVLRMHVHGDQVYFAGSGKKVVQAAVVDLKPGRTWSPLRDWVYALAIDPPTRRLAVGGYDGTVTVWNLEDGSLVAQFSGAPGHAKKEAAVSVR